MSQHAAGLRSDAKPAADAGVALSGDPDGATKAGAVQPRDWSNDPNARHFRTDHLLKDLKSRSIKGGMVTLTTQVARFLVQTGTTMVLARLLTPSAFGLIAMVTAVTGFVSMFKEAGLTMATVQRKEITHEQVSTLFWINVGLSVVLMLIVAALSPAIAAFYGRPELLAITLVIGGTFLFGGLTIQHMALLRRQMRFGVLGAAEIISIFVGAIVAVALAFNGFGVWSLVWMSVATSVSLMIFVWLVSGWRPGPPRRRTGVRPMLAFGGNLTGSSVVDYLTKNVDNVLIARVWGAGPVGLYTKAYGLLMLPVRQIQAPISAAVLPALSRLQDNPTRFRRFFLLAFQGSMALAMPVMAFSFVAAEPVVAIVLGEQWSGAVPIFRWLAPAALVATMNYGASWLFIALGRADRALRQMIVVGVVTIAAFVAGLPWGPIGVAVGFSASQLLLRPFVMWYALRDSPVSNRDAFGAAWRPVTASLVAAAGGMLADRLGSAPNPLLDLFLLGGVFATLYVGVWLLVPGGREILREVRDQMRSLRARADRSDGDPDGRSKPAVAADETSSAAPPFGTRAEEG